jgi:hypothetical protein
MDPLSKALDEFYAAQNAAEPAPESSSIVTFKPMKSRALKVHPSQVEEAREFAAKNDCPTDYLPDGHPVITSSRQFRKLAKLAGFIHQGY